MSIYFFVILLHSPRVWLFDIWHLFDNLTSFWQLDIFLGHMGNRTHGQCDMGRSIMVNIEDRDRVPWVMGHMGDGAPWGMGHMGNWAHDHNFLNTAWIFIKILLNIDIDVFYLNIQWYYHDGLFKVQKLIDLKFWLVPTLVLWTCSNELIWYLPHISVISWTFS